MILNHISLGTEDVGLAATFYDAVLETLSIKRTHSIEGVAIAYGEQFEFWVGLPTEGRPTAGNGVHIAFNAPDRQAVDKFYQVALNHGATCEGKPGLRPEYGETYYAAFVRDLDGNKIEAVNS
ncbi:VOC family protein [Vibrio sp. SCSIO 43136]|uniref:VOC family protein n=1 Tax=Vibrio sp. SCSIO 43136 TaxID=2819101 RepID=UPI00207594B1|nr:VOC family protein [Vibrio sp. SCSIO 43136]USD64055.1 VOC family protein [Vibrio sp. SCSIO 43136]